MRASRGTSVFQEHVEEKVEEKEEKEETMKATRKAERWGKNTKAPEWRFSGTLSLSSF